MSKIPSFFFVDKPAGLATHAVAKGRYAAPGFNDYLAQTIKTPVFVCHRLDKGTTGAMVFARNEQTTAEISQLFADRKVAKKYLFISSGKVTQETYRVESFIEKRGGKFVSEKSSSPNAATELRLLRREGKFSLWEALPETGRPHQIRLHAAGVGLPVLGDSEHGGESFPHLCLHSSELTFELAGEAQRYSALPPVFFSQMRLLSNARVCLWISANDRRQRWTRTWRALDPDVTTSTQRLIHTEGNQLRIDKLGEYHDLQWFDDSAPSEKDWADIRLLLETLEIKKWRLHLRQNRGAKPNAQLVWESSQDLGKRWQAQENNLFFELREDSGLSAGLFLDQRANRGWVRAHAQGKSVLNLFCYTGVFGVAAALGGAANVVSVDVSKNFLEWTKTNFSLNGLQPDSFEFRAMDAREYLKYALKKSITFDLIVCDPPSFGRSDKGVFKIEKDLPQLLSALDSVLSKEGVVLFSANYEGWRDQRDFDEALSAALKSENVNLRIVDEATRGLPYPDLDFELPDQPRLMKCALLART